MISTIPLWPQCLLRLQRHHRNMTYFISILKSLHVVLSKDRSVPWRILRGSFRFKSISVSGVSSWVWSWYSTTQSLCSLGPPVTTHSCLSQNSERRQGDGERKDETPLSFSHPCSVCLSISPEHPYPLLAEKYCLTLSHLHISSLASFCHGPSLPTHTFLAYLTEF